MKDNKFDLVIGSRYLPGGTLVNFQLHRLILSRLTNMFLRFWLGVRLTDYTGGFRLYNKSAVEFLLHAHLKSTGFITLSEIVYTLARNSFTIGEVPITMHGSENRTSTVNAKLFFNSLWFVIKMRLRREG